MAGPQERRFERVLERPDTALSIRRENVVVALALCACTETSYSEPRVDTSEIAHAYAGRAYSVVLLPDLDGVTFVTGDGEKLFLPGEPMARLAVSGGGIGRRDRDLALAVVRDFCAGREEFACLAFRPTIAGRSSSSGAGFFSSSEAVDGRPFGTYGQAAAGRASARIRATRAALILDNGANGPI